MGDLINKEKLQKVSDKILEDLKENNFCNAEIKLILSSVLDLVRYETICKSIRDNKE